MKQLMWRRKIKVGTDRAVKKMKSQKGASLFLALMFFLICSLAGCAILTIAKAYEKRTAVRPEEERQYLAVLSAAEFLKEQLASCEGQWSLGLSGIDLEKETENEVHKALLETLYAFCREYAKHPAAAKKELGLEIALKDHPDPVWAMPDVKVKITLEADDRWETSEEGVAPIGLEALFFLEEEKNSSMSLRVTGTVIYEADALMEVYWERMEIGR